ncbi:MAG: dTDP-4-dehydrorhamnose reductase [Ginsengibacter sp.]
MDTKYPSYNPELWGGVECTINRVNNTFRDQLDETGHYVRNEDIQQFSLIGIKKIRYPILWEAHQKNSQDEPIDWKRSTEILEELQSLKITPIVGLLHHGSGPIFTELLDDKFPEMLAGYASKVAKQFPWINFYTPVNEPLTTARFSGLYGLWYPHLKSDLAFSKIFLNQLKGVVLSMQAIRKINPKAKLIQTEDLGKTHSTPALKYQADFENERRWLTYDFLCGKVNNIHAMWAFFIEAGITENELNFFVENPCPPDIAGFNYYITSERFLHKCSPHDFDISSTGNKFEKYSDTDSVRSKKLTGLKSLLKEAWERYKIPLALTEVHMSCTREEQMRWFKEAWDICKELIKMGITIEGITAWSLLGAMDWNSLLTRKENNYESGVFDVTGNKSRKTALGSMISSLCKEGDCTHPVLQEKGWWHRSYPQHKNYFSNTVGRPILIIGCHGTLGVAFTNICNQRALVHRALSRQQLDITNPKQIEENINRYKPWAIINAAGYVKVDEAECNKELCFNLNTHGPANLASLCQEHGIQLVTFSSDMVFDGNKESPYTEIDYVKPINTYGESKAKAEKLVSNIFSDSLIIRTSSFFGPWDKFNFAYHIIEELKAGKKCRIVEDVTVSPTYVPHLVNSALNLLIDGEKGIWHITNEGNLSWYQFATQISESAGFDSKDIIPITRNEMNWPAPRPVYSALESDKGISLPCLDKALVAYFEEKIN